MAESENSPSIYEALRFVQLELKAPKGQRNSFGNYDYRSAEDILEAVKPVLAANGLTLLVDDEIVLIGDRYYVKATATVLNERGESIAAHASAREAEDKKGMDSAQVTGATSSYARKYALNGLFAIDDSKDADTNEHKQVSESRTSTTTNPVPKASATKPASDKQKSMIAALAHKVGKDNDWIDAVMAKTVSSADASTVIEKLQALEKGEEPTERVWKK
jgi:hypothetical protein